MVIFNGKDWPTFNVLPGYLRNRDGAPVIVCQSHRDGQQFVITVERWLRERRNGGIVRFDKV